MEMTVTFRVNEEQIEELKLLQAAMKKADPNGDKDDYYTLEKVFSFAMELGSTHRINKAIENAAYHYDRYYDDYPYKYGVGRTHDIFEEEKKVGHYLDTAYPNPRIVRD